MDNRLCGLWQSGEDEEENCFTLSVLGYELDIDAKWGLQNQEMFGRPDEDRTERLFNFNAYKLASFVSKGWNKKHQQDWSVHVIIISFLIISLVFSCSFGSSCSDSGIWFVHFWYLVSQSNQNHKSLLGYEHLSQTSVFQIFSTDCPKCWKQFNSHLKCQIVSQFLGCSGFPGAPIWLFFFSSELRKRRLLSLSSRTHAIRSFLEKLKYLLSEAGKRGSGEAAAPDSCSCIQACRFASNPASHSR